MDQRNGERRDERNRRDSEKDKERAKPPSAREWDLGKEKDKGRARSRSRDRRKRHSGKRSPTPLEGIKDNLSLLLYILSFFTFLRLHCKKAEKVGRICAPKAHG